jgi:hypothetical protein
MCVTIRILLVDTRIDFAMRDMPPTCIRIRPVNNTRCHTAAYNKSYHQRSLSRLCPRPKATAGN